MPALELKQRILVEAEPDGKTPTSQGLVEHATESWTIDAHRFHPKADNPAAELIHDHQDPVGFEQDGFSPEQISAPQTVLGMAKEREPSGPTVPAISLVMGGQNPADDILVQSQTESLGQMLGDFRTAKAGITALKFRNGLNQVRGRPSGPGPVLRAQGVEQSIFEVPEPPRWRRSRVEGRRMRALRKSRRRLRNMEQNPAEPAVGGPEVGRSSPRPSQEQKLLFKEEVFCQQGSWPSTSQERDQTGQEAQDEPQQVLHVDHLTHEDHPGKDGRLRFQTPPNC